MLISVIIPVYNVEKYLIQCIKSVLNQTYKKIEIILVDDGSTDKSGQICDEYANKYDNIKVIHKKNEGLGYARNTGLSKCNGQLVTFIDSDDYIEKNMIEKLYDEMQKNNVDIIKSGYIKFDDNNTINYERHYTKALLEGKNVREQFMTRMLGSLPNKKDSIEMSAWGCLYKMSYIKKNNLKFPSEREMIAEDIIFHFDYSKYISSAYITDYSGYYYRTNDNSLTRKYREDRFEATKKLYIEISERIKEGNFKEEALLRFKKLFFVYIRTCLSQENKKISKKNKKEIKKNIKKICNDNIVRNVIKNYPIEKLQIKQKFFVTLLKYKLTNIIYLFIELNLI